VSDLTTTICIAISVMLSLKVIDFSHLEFLDVCIIVLFMIMAIIQISNHFRKLRR
jgi:mannitol/fructose-specific phosphotransferase system IIA component (Ntr-type)